MMRSLDHLFGVLLNNKGLKLLALLLATVTWLFIREATSYEETFHDIPIEVLPPEGWAVQGRSARHVAVTFLGSQSDIRNLSKDQIRVQVDARNRKDEPSMVIEINRASVSSPRAVRPVRIDPAEIELTLDRETEKVVPIEVAKLGEPPEGYYVERYSVTPSNVTLYGPERRLAAVEFVRTTPLDMAGRIRSFSISSTLLQPGDTWQARMDVDRVTLNFTIVEQTVRQDFESIPVHALIPSGITRPVAFFPPNVNVALKGRVDVISNLTRNTVHAFVNLTTPSSTNATTPDYTVEITTLPGIGVVLIDPPTVRLVEPRTEP